MVEISMFMGIALAIAAGCVIVCGVIILIHLLIRAFLNRNNDSDEPGAGGGETPFTEHHIVYIIEGSDEGGDGMNGEKN